MRNSETVVLRSLVDPFHKILSVLSFMVIPTVLWNASYFLDTESYFLLIFTMSLGLYFSVHPWTQIKQIELSENELKVGAVLSSHVITNFEIINTKRITSVELERKKMTIISASVNIEIRASAFEILQGQFDNRKKGEVLKLRDLKILIEQRAGLHER